MPDSNSKLNEILEYENECFSDLTDLLKDLCYAFKKRDKNSIDELFKEINDIYFEIQTTERERIETAKIIAAKNGCTPKVTDLQKYMTPLEQNEFNSLTERLSSSIKNVKRQTAIISSIIEQHGIYAAMMLSEWQRLSSEKGNNNILKLSENIEFKG